MTGLSVPVLTKADKVSPGDNRPACYNRRMFRFRNYRLYPSERELFREGECVGIGSRAFDLLLLLVESEGSIVSKKSILDHVWPSIFVDESNIRFQMGSLRKILGNDRDLIKTVPGRGYLFVVDPIFDDQMPVPYVNDGPVIYDPVLPSTRHGTCSTMDQTLVAVIDDDDATREALEGFLSCSGLSPVCFPSIQAFRQQASTIDAKCLVLDVCLPGQTGLDFQAELVEAGLNLPIIFISGHADIHMSVRAMKAGAREFLTKPVRHEELLDAIHAAVSTYSGRFTDKNSGRAH